MVNARVAPSGAERVAADPRLVAEFVRHYTGVHDPLDALWWMTHPADPSPSGRSSPLDELRPLERIVYGVPSTAVAEATEQLHRLMQTVESERRLTRTAVDAALATESQTAARPTEQTVRTERPEPSHPEARVRTTRRRLYRATMLTSAAILGVLIGVLGGGLLPHQAEAPTADAAGALAIFDRPQVAADLPPNASNAEQLSAASFRALVDSPPLYVARAESGKEVCLVLVQPTGETSASCVDSESFPRSGLNIKGRYQNPGTIQAGNAGAATFRPVDVTWLPDGNLYTREPATDALFQRG